MSTWLKKQLRSLVCTDQAWLSKYYWPVVKIKPGSGYDRIKRANVCCSDVGMCVHRTIIPQTSPSELTVSISHTQAQIT